MKLTDEHSPLGAMATTALTIIVQVSRLIVENVSPTRHMVEVP